MPHVTVRAPLHPSEDPVKVTRAIRNLFPDARVHAGEAQLVGETEDLAPLGQLIRRQKILDAARKTFLRGLDPDGHHARFRLNKQAAFAGRVSFSADLEAPLGDIEVEAQDPRLESLLKEMAPMTIRGVPVSEEEADREVARRRARRGPGAKADEADDDLDDDEEDAQNNDDESGEGEDDE